MWTLGATAVAAIAVSILALTPNTHYPFSSSSPSLGMFFRYCYKGANHGTNGNQLHLLNLPRYIHPNPTLFVHCSSNEGAAGAGDNFPSDNQSLASSREISTKVAKLGLAAVLAYGLFDGVAYTTFFVLAFLGYEKSTGKRPAANLQALLGEQYHKNFLSSRSSYTGTNH